MDQHTTEYFYAVRHQQYIYVACVTLWLYEYCCTFILEVQHIWGACWTPTKGLFLLTRYLQFSLVGVLVHRIGISGPGPVSAKNCIRTEKFIIAMVDVCMCLAEIIFTIRTWAVLGRTRRSGAFLAAFFLALWVPMLVLTAYWVPDITPSPIPVPLQVLTIGCLTIIRSNLKYVNYILLVPFYVVTASLMAIKGFEHFVERSSYSHFMWLVYLDGILYYVYLLVLSIINLIIIYAASPRYADILALLQQFIASILACRMMLNLRAHDQARFGTIHISSLHFDVTQTSNRGESEEDSD